MDKSQLRGEAPSGLHAAVRSISLCLSTVQVTRLAGRRRKGERRPLLASKMIRVHRNIYISAYMFIHFDGYCHFFQYFFSKKKTSRVESSRVESSGQGQLLLTIPTPSCLDLFSPHSNSSNTDSPRATAANELYLKPRCVPLARQLLEQQPPWSQGTAKC